MANDFIKEKQFEMKLIEIYRQHPWLGDEISQQEFICLFPMHYKNGNPQRPEKPAEVDLDRDTFLKVLVAFKSSFS
ncbi:hypothetical protein [Pararcticibacter amylolyticus]|uniref:Uncharacterized protein n=1 Tax=Pararcticibacter amylolyticus TaxID=2173175 RepID=A0A2U2PAY9_9SPHI|nr:hypothetical protein [Pararcticibacter amylolyticus]PWG78571.1 hypothetical protein DDR33_21655 [Pararcticibacter amylolyticus]